MLNRKALFRVWVSVLAAAWVLVCVTDSSAGNPLGGAELETGCRTYAQKAVKMAEEWKQRDCGKKLNLGVQLMDTDFNFHYNRCVRSVGTTIDADLQELKKYIEQCRGVTGVAPPVTGATPPPPQPPPTQPPQTRPPTPPVPAPSATGNVSAGDVWDLVVINSVDLKRSQQTYRIPGPLNGHFKGQNVIAGNPEFEGDVSGSAFRAVMTDRTGYRAEFFGRMAAPGRIEGTGCDNRNRGFSYTLIKR